MNVKFYKYVGEPNVLNKIKGIEHVADLNVKKYGDLNPLGMYFELGTLYNTNYCEYSFNGITYFATVEVSSSAEGVYNYACRVDSATTAWYADCMNVDAKIAFSNQGSNKLKDPRIDTDTFADYNHVILKNDIYESKKVFYCINVVSPNVTETSASATTVRCFLIEQSGLQKFFDSMNALTSEDRQTYMPSLLDIYVVRGLSNTDLQPYNSVAAIPLAASITDVYEITKEKTIAKTKDISVSGNVCKEITVGRMFMDLENKPFNYTPNTLNLDVEFTMHWGLEAVWKFNLADLGIRKVTSFGVRKIYNFISAEIMYVPAINSAEYPEMAIRKPITEKAPFLYNRSIIDWNGLKGQLLTTGIQIASIALTAGAGAAAAGAATAGVGAASIAEGQTALSTGAKFAGGSHFYQKVFGRQATAQGNSLIAAGMAEREMAKKDIIAHQGMTATTGIATSLIQGVADLAMWGSRQRQAGKLGSAVQGSIGVDGSSIYNLNKFWVEYAENLPVTDITKYQSKYGKPDGEIRNLSTMKGYVITQVIYLHMNGLTPGIIAEATEACMSGIYIK